MTEEAELQAKIAAIAGRINQHKQHQSGALYPPSGQRYQYAAPPSRSYTHRSPYARGGRVPHTQIHRNRTLVLGGTQTPPSSTSGTATPSTPPVPNSAAPTESFVSTRGAGTNSLMKKDTFDREQKQRLERKDQRRAAKRQKLNRDEKIKLMQHVRTASTSGSREMIVEGLRFQLRDDGSKLIRISDPSASNRDTPKQVQIAGVDFVRTRNGNLVRANAVRDLGRSNPFKGPCANFTKNGTCPFGSNCKFTHDPDKVAVCKTFLRTGACPAGEHCDLSHELTYHRVPACQHFLRGHCTKDPCPYPHINVSPAAPVCRPFALLGYCPTGDDCTKRHVSECPEYDATGSCATRNCPLPHIDRASHMRKLQAKQDKIVIGSDDESDTSSNEENSPGDGSFEDIDSDEAEDIIMGGDEDSHELSQQHDFISFR